MAGPDGRCDDHDLDRSAAEVDLRGCEGSERADVRCLQTLGSLLDVELNALVLLEVTTTGARNRAEVRENVGGAVLGGDEAVALVGVDPGDDASSHGDIPSLSYATCVARVSVAAAPLRICCTPREATTETVLTFDTGCECGLEGRLRRDQ